VSRPRLLDRLGEVAIERTVVELLAILEADASDPKRHPMWRYGVRHALTFVPALITPPNSARVRYRLEGGVMMPNPEGQWVHIGSLGPTEWILDAPALTEIEGAR
jgi:hypothetical protein